MKILKLTHANGKPVLIPLDHISYVADSGMSYADGTHPKSLIHLVGNSYVVVMESTAVVGRKMRRLA